MRGMALSFLDSEDTLSSNTYIFLPCRATMSTPRSADPDDLFSCNPAVWSASANSFSNSTARFCRGGCMGTSNYHGHDNEHGHVNIGGQNVNSPPRIKILLSVIPMCEVGSR